MKCFTCKTYFNPKRTGYKYMLFRTKNGLLRRLTWCLGCDKNNRNVVNKEYDRRLKIDEEYMRRIRDAAGI